MTYPWKDLLTRNIMRLRKRSYDIPDQNGSLLKLTSCLPLTGYHTGQSWHAQLYIAPLFLLYLAIYNESSLKNVLQLKICPPHILEAAQIFYLKAFFVARLVLNSKIKDKLWCNLQLWTPTLSETADC